MKELQYRLTSLTEVENCIDQDKPLAVDFETDGFYGNIELAQFYQADWPEVLLVRKPEILHLPSVLQNVHFLAHNLSYEVSTIQTQLGELFGVPLKYWAPTKFDDTLLLAKLQYWKQEFFSLDKCYQYLLGFDPYQANDIDKTAMQKSNWAALELSDDQLTYAALDVFYMPELYEACSSHVEKQYYILDKLASANAYKFQVNGVPLNEDRVHAMIAKCEARIAEIGVPVNVNSWQQVRPYVGESESDGLALATFALEGNERAGQVNETRKLKKQISFLDKFLDTAVDGRIYGKFMFTTKSGRGNCKDQNLQQIPRSTKTVFEAPEGRVFVMSDFAQLELRYICAISGEPRMAKMFKDGLDMHSYTAEMMDVPRQQSKTCNFNLGYGGSAKMLRSIFIKDAGMLLPLRVVADLKTRWHDLWETLTAWQDQATRDWRAGKPFETLLGRKMYAKLYTDAMNLPIQGGSADISKLAMHKMFKELEAKPELLAKSTFCNFIHDSFMWECPDDPTIYEPLALITAQAMKDAWEELVQFTLIPDLPMPVDVQVGKNWGEIEYEIETPTYTLTI